MSSVTFDFLWLIAGGDTDGFIEVRHFPGPKQNFFAIGDLGRAAQMIASAASAGDVYVGIAPRTRREGTNAAVHHGWVLAVDCDTDIALERLERFEVMPTMVIASGGLTGSGARKRHVYYALDEPLGRDELVAAKRRLAAHLGADMVATDAARILRPPGSLNHKGRTPAPVELIHHANVSYRPVDVIGHLPEPELERRPRPAEPPPGREGTRRTASEALRENPPPVSPLVEALRAIPAEDYVEALTGQQPGHNGKIECPFHDDWNPSFHVYGGDRGWYCHQCNRGGDVFNLAADCWDLDCRDDFVAITRQLERVFS